MIMPGVHIGDGTMIELHSVVAKDVPLYCVAAVNPVRVLKKWFIDELAELLLGLK